MKDSKSVSKHWRKRWKMRLILC